MTLAESIKKRRAALKLPQEAVARRADLTLATYARIERGEQKNPRLDTIKKIARGLGTTASELLEGSDG